MNIKKILFLILLLLGLGAGVFLVQRVQETRRGAVYTQAEVWWLPEEIGTDKEVGDSFSASLVADLGSETMTGFAIKIEYDKDRLELDEAGVEVNEAFDDVIKRVDQANGEVELVYISVGGVSGVMGITNPWMKLNFRILAEGSAEVRLITSETEYVRYQVVGEVEEGDDEIELRNRDGSIAGDEGIKVVYGIGLQEVEPTGIVGCGSDGCGWCGTSCQPVDPTVECIDVLPPDGMSCVCENDSCVTREEDECSVQDDCAITASLGWAECNQVDCVNGNCVQSEKDNGTACVSGGEEGTCLSGSCVVTEVVEGCSSAAQCSVSITDPSWYECNYVACVEGECQFGVRDDGTGCTAADGEGGSCVGGGCVSNEPTDAVPTEPEEEPTAVPTEPVEEPTDAPTGDWPVLNFLVKFSGITQDTDYNQSSVVDVTVVSADGSQEIYRGVNVSREEGRDPGVYRGMVELVGFNRGMSNSVLIDGPKHLQTKFCNANQATVCVSYTGSVVLMERGDDAPLYNFSGWEIAAGDIPNTEGVRDGVVDVADYTRVVESLGAGRRAEESYVSRCDINGNGIVDTLDLGALLETLSERYGELY